jgi:hypothetical protein
LVGAAALSRRSGALPLIELPLHFGLISLEPVIPEAFYPAFQRRQAIAAYAIDPPRALGLVGDQTGLL